MQIRTQKKKRLSDWVRDMERSFSALHCAELFEKKGTMKISFILLVGNLHSTPNHRPCKVISLGFTVEHSTLYWNASFSHISLALHFKLSSNFSYRAQSFASLFYVAIGVDYAVLWDINIIWTGKNWSNDKICKRKTLVRQLNYHIVGCLFPCV